MAPNADAEPVDVLEGAPRFEKLVAPSADDHRFEILPVEGPVLFAWAVGGLYCGYISLTQAKWPTLLYTLFTVVLAMIGMGAGAHRLWSHRAFKAKPQLEWLLGFFYILTNMKSGLTWAKRHRLHHQCSDTDGDPHNATRGFWFSHYGWALLKPHPEVAKRQEYIDVSDLLNNPIVKFQHDYFVPLVIIFSYGIHVYIPMLWGESFFVSLMACMFRMNIALHLICAINSFAHMVGYKPIDTAAVGTQTRLLGLLTSGEGFHNYHHTFPYDYRSSELGDVNFNISALFIEWMEKIGWAYDLKVTSEEVVKNRVLKKGDGYDMHYIPNNEKKQNFFCMTLYKENEPNGKLD